MIGSFLNAFKHSQPIPKLCLISTGYLSPAANWSRSKLDAAMSLCLLAGRDTCWPQMGTAPRRRGTDMQLDGNTPRAGRCMIKHFIHSYYQHSGLWEYHLKKIKEAKLGRYLKFTLISNPLLCCSSGRVNYTSITLYI